MQSLPLSHHSLENHTTIMEQSLSVALFFGGVARGDPSQVPVIRPKNRRIHTVFKKLQVAAIRDTEQTSLICSMTMRGANTGRAFMTTCSYNFPVNASVLCRSTSRLIMNAVVSMLSLLQSHVIKSQASPVAMWLQCEAPASRTQLPNTCHRSSTHIPLMHTNTTLKHIASCFACVMENINALMWSVLIRAWWMQPVGVGGSGGRGELKEATERKRKKRREVVALLPSKPWATLITPFSFAH